jgi:hypothetical protein
MKVAPRMKMGVRSANDETAAGMLGLEVFVRTAFSDGRSAQTP